MNFTDIRIPFGLYLLKSAFLYDIIRLITNPKGKNVKYLICFLQVIVLLISQLCVYNYGLKQKLDRFALGLTSFVDWSYDPIEAEKLEITDAEKARCRKWFDENIRTDKSPAFDFSVGGYSLQKHLDDWEITVGEEKNTPRGGKTTKIELKHKKSALYAWVDAVIYEKNAACEWTVYIRNIGDSISPRVKSFYAAKCSLEAGERTDALFSRGSSSSADDFELLRSHLEGTPLVFSANAGRTESFLPFFNLCGSRGGIVASIGWTGQWYASLRLKRDSVQFRAKQEKFSSPLEPGEEIRSPLVSLCFYDDENPVKGFESFRKMMLDCICPENVEPMRSFLIANEFSTLNCVELIEKLDKIDRSVLDSSDTMWMDAGWYEYKKGWYDGVGNWTEDSSRFPDGLKPFSDAVESKGKRFLLWYEPERIREGTILYDKGKENPGWTINIDDNTLWNLADDDACDFLADYISESLVENGVKVYRQDFNFYPLHYWNKADKELSGHRRGISENHYVTNLYRYLDTLAQRIDGLIIDNCASGGRRIDIEMCRRSVPLWRSDYNCVDADGNTGSELFEATQAMTCGLSCWLPFSGTMQSDDSLYALRSGIMTHPLWASDEKADFSVDDAVRKHMTENYFPLHCGGADTKLPLAMQFGSGESGAALIYIRENCSETYHLCLNGLYLDTLYTLTDTDNPAFSVKKIGRELMEDGIDISAPEKPYAFVILYETVKK